MHWYATLGHYNIANTQKLMSAVGIDTEPVLKPKESGVAACSVPLCPSFLRGKGGITTLNSKVSYPDSEHSDVIKDGDLIQRDCVSTDQYECSVKGRLLNIRGRGDHQKIYCGGSFFNDHTSSK